MIIFIRNPFFHLKCPNVKNLLSLLFTILFLAFIVQSCQKENGVDSTQLVTTLSGQNFSLNSAEDLTAFVSSTIEEPEAVIMNPDLIRGQDDSGPFYLVNAKLKRGEVVQSLVISLRESEIRTVDNPGIVMLTTECTMTCTPDGFCDGCEQTVISPCQSQDCRCTGGTGGCVSSITFGDEK